MGNILRIIFNIDDDGWVIDEPSSDSEGVSSNSYLSDTSSSEDIINLKRIK